MCAFSYTVPTTEKVRTFLLAGQADIGSNGKIIAEGDTSPAAMEKRARFTIDTVGETLQKLGTTWNDTTRIALFHVHDIPDLWGVKLLGALGEPIRHGMLTYRARPPIVGGEVELEARAIRQEIVVANQVAISRKRNIIVCKLFPQRGTPWPSPSFPVTDAFAAEIGDVDLSQPLSAEDFAAIEAAFNQYSVLVFPDQHLSVDQHLAFAETFRRRWKQRCTPFAVREQLRERPEIADVSNSFLGQHTLG